MKLAFALPAAALAVAAPAAAAAAEKPKLPPYAESIRCAGLAEAAAGREADGIRSGRTYYDAAMFWGMAASEAAREGGISGARFSADQLDAASKAGQEMDAGGDTAAAAAGELARCVARVPPLPPAAKGERG